MYMNKWTPEERKKVLIIPLFYISVSLENKMKAAVVSLYSFPLITSSEHISSMPTQPQTHSPLPHLPI